MMAKAIKTRELHYSLIQFNKDEYATDITKSLT